MRRILVVKLADLGDVLLCEPAFRSLRLGFPDAEVDVLVTPTAAPLVKLLGHDLNTIVFDKTMFDRARGIVRPGAAGSVVRLALRLRRRKYTSLVLLHHLTTAGGAKKFEALTRAVGARNVVGLDNGRGRFLTHRVDDLGFGFRHEAEYMQMVARAAGGAQVDSVPSFVASSTDYAEAFSRRYVVIHPVTGPYSPARTWPTDRWSHVASRLHDEGIGVVIAGAHDASAAASEITRTVPQAIDLTGQTGIAELATILKHASCVVGGDSFVGHLAAAVQTPTVTVFGPSNSDAWRPQGPRSSQRIVLHHMPCQPCIYTGFSLGRPMGCPDRTCLKRVQVDDVVSAVASVVGAA